MSLLQVNNLTHPLAGALGKQTPLSYTDKKENKIFLIYKKIQMGLGAKSWLTNKWGNAQIFSPYMRRSLVIYDFALDPSEFPHIWDEAHLIFFFISVITWRIFALMKQCDETNHFQYCLNLLINEMARTDAKRKERRHENKGRFTL